MLGLDEMDIADILLTPQEAFVVQQVIDGETLERIAQRAGVGTKAVIHTLERAMKKVNRQRELGSPKKFWGY